MSTEIRKQLNDQLSCIDFRAESKLLVLSDIKEFFKRRGQIEFENARSLDRLCEKFDKSQTERK